jgi:hypothetical protein
MMVTIRLVSVSIQWSQITAITILHNNFTSLCVHLSAITTPNKHRDWKNEGLQLTMSAFPFLRDRVQHNSSADMRMVPHIGCSDKTLLQCRGDHSTVCHRALCSCCCSSFNPSQLSTNNSRFAIYLDHFHIQQPTTQSLRIVLNTHHSLPLQNKLCWFHLLCETVATTRKLSRMFKNFTAVEVIPFKKKCKQITEEIFLFRLPLVL